MVTRPDSPKYFNIESLIASEEYRIRTSRVTSFHERSANLPPAISAEDIAQQVNLRFLSKWSAPKDFEQLKSWADSDDCKTDLLTYVIGAFRQEMRNGIWAFLSREKKKLERPIEIEQLSGTPEIDFANKFDMHYAMTAAGLSDLQKDILRKKYWDDQTDEQIASDLGLKRSTTNRIRRIALKKLLQIVNDR